MIHYCLLLVLLTSVYAETEKIKSSVKVVTNNKVTKFSCTFTLVREEKNVSLTESKVACKPNKPKNRTKEDFEVSTDLATYKLSFNINPENLTEASVAVKEEKK